MIGGRETIVRVRDTPVVEGKFGDPPADPAPPARKRYDGCIVFPRYSEEAEGRQSTVIVGYTALVDLPADIVSSDRIEWRGETYEITGRPGEWRHLSGADAALQVALKWAED